jgi:hypothetical protein
MRLSPGQDDRLIGRQDLGGYGGGRILCPIFDIEGPRRNFGFKPSDIPQGSGFGPLRQAAAGIVAPDLTGKTLSGGLIRVLNIPTLYYYSIETHYGMNVTHRESDATPETTRQRLVDFQVRNWVTLVTRALGKEDARNPKFVREFLDTAIVLVRFTGTIDPRKNLLDVQTTMNGQIVPRQSYGVAVPNPARVLIKARVRTEVQVLEERTKNLLGTRLRK